MSVYTELTAADIQALLAEYDLGNYVSHQGISAGVENTNYFVETHQHSLVLTLFEKLSETELPFYLQLGEHLFNDHCKVPQPFRDVHGKFLQQAKGKPAVFIERLTGKHVEANADYAFDMAKALAQVHLSTATFDKTHAHSHDAVWIKTTAESLRPEFSIEDQSLLDDCLRLIGEIPSDLPKGIIHADLFHDNALFDNGHITGIIDWYFAGLDSYALDIAITMNDWCLNKKGEFDPQQGQAFIDAYQTVRPLNALEVGAIKALQVQSATRFWLSRYLAQREHLQSTEQITVKDPNMMKNLAQQLIGYTHS